MGSIIDFFFHKKSPCEVINIDLARPAYVKLYCDAKILNSKIVDIALALSNINDARPDYEYIERQTSVPWFLIATIHMREGNNNFSKNLRDGSDVGSKSEWYENALAVVNTRARPEKWDLAGCLWFAESWNGWGYFERGLNSPYLWSMTSQYQSGKFDIDGHFDPGLIDEQVGVAATLKLMEQREIIFWGNP